MTVDGRRQRLGQQLEDVLPLLGQSLALLHILAGNGGTVVGSPKDHVVGQQDSLERAGSVATLLTGKTAERGNNLENTKNDLVS